MKAELEMLARLQRRYAEPHRHYHVWSHVQACLRASRLLMPPEPPQEVDLALLFHDAIYDPLAADNEERSAALLLEEGGAVGLDTLLLLRAGNLIRATKHSEATATGLAAVVVDADLSILGEAPEVFGAYEAAVRQEYWMVPDDIYDAGRTRIMRQFLTRPTIYATSRAQQLWEEQARRNLQRYAATTEDSSC